MCNIYSPPPEHTIHPFGNNTQLQQLDVVSVGQNNCTQNLYHPSFSGKLLATTTVA
jgi:hypothetical protein